ncbi:hypothetical protein [Embleya sp. AB8]|uniref:hypothetical protein n=1 Tax=Embleya sp. AB8 TaxID=3156304 RepID=UPI003C781D2F
MGFRDWWRDRRAAKYHDLDRRIEHRRRMEAAAGVASIQVYCHQDTWAFIHEQAERAPLSLNGTYIPPRAEDVSTTNGMIEARVSGPQLAHLIATMNLANRSGFGVNGAIARRVYSELARVVDAIEPDSDRSRPVQPIVLDDR